MGWFKALVMIFIISKTIGNEHCQPNLAYNKRAVLSSTMAHHRAESCVDGYLETMCHTLYESSPYLYIDLGQSYDIKRIDIFNRFDGFGDRLDNLMVTIGEDLHHMNYCGRYGGPGHMAELIVIRCNKRGRYVKLTNRNNYLNLGEVKVFGQ